MAELNERERELLEDAASWRLLGLSLERPRGDWADTIRAITRDRAVDPRVAATAARTADESTEQAFLAMFGPGGAASPREVSYRRMGDPGRILAELKVIYDAFAFIPQTEEPPDHVSVEVGFVGYLRLKEAFARMTGDDGSADVIRDASTLFIVEHLSYLVAGLQGRLPEGFFRDTIQIIAERVGPIPSEIIVSARAAASSEDFESSSGCSFVAE